MAADLKYWTSNLKIAGSISDRSQPLRYGLRYYQTDSGFFPSNENHLVTMRQDSQSASAAKNSPSVFQIAYYHVLRDLSKTMNVRAHLPRDTPAST